MLLWLFFLQECLERVSFQLDETSGKALKDTVKSRTDWCISRQRCWGVPIPAFYSTESDKVLMTR